jgi:hypothetical protein
VIEEILKKEEPNLFEYNEELLTLSTRKSFFLSFLESEHSEENLLFYTDILKYRTLQEEKERVELAFAIYHQFIKFQVVNLSSSVFKSINEKYSSAPPDLFDTASQEIFLNMRDPFSRFKKSKEFKIMLRVNFNQYQQNLINKMENYK